MELNLNYASMSKKVVFLITFDGFEPSEDSAELQAKLINSITKADSTTRIYSFKFDVTKFLYDINFLLMKRCLQPSDEIKVIFYLQLGDNFNCFKLMSVQQSVQYLQIPFKEQNLGLIAVHVQGKDNDGMFSNPFAPPKSPKTLDVFECLDEKFPGLVCRNSKRCSDPKKLINRKIKGAFTNWRIYPIFEGESLVPLQRDIDVLINKKMKFIPVTTVDLNLFHPKTWTTVSQFYDQFYMIKEAEVEDKNNLYIFKLPRTLSFLTLAPIFKVYGVAHNVSVEYRPKKFENVVADLRGRHYLSAENQRLLSQSEVDYLVYQLIIVVHKLNLRVDIPSSNIRRSIYRLIDMSVTPTIMERNCQEFKITNKEDFLVHLYWYQMQVSLQSNVKEWKRRFFANNFDSLLTWLEQKTHDFACEIIEDALRHVALVFPYAYQPLDGVETNFDNFYHNLTTWLQKAPEISNIYYSWPDFKQWIQNFSVPEKFINSGESFNKFLKSNPEYAHESFQVYYHSPRFLRKVSRIFDDFKVNATTKVIRQLAKSRLPDVHNIVVSLNAQLQLGVEQKLDEMSHEQWLVYRKQTFYQLLNIEDLKHPLNRFCRNLKVFFEVHDIPISEHEFGKLFAVNQEFQNIQELVDEVPKQPIDTRQQWGQKLIGTREFMFRNSAPDLWSVGPSVLLVVVYFIVFFIRMLKM